MTQEQWSTVDHYFESLFLPTDPALEEALKAIAAAGMPAISVSATQGKLLYLLARLRTTRSILEVGTLGGYSTIWMARGLAEGGHVVTLEIDPHHAEVARANFARANLAEVIEVVVGPAVETLPQVAQLTTTPFDLVFIDADKVNTPAYLTWALKLTQAGSLIIIDNVVRNGAVTDPNNPDPSVQGIRQALQMLADEPRLSVTALQTVGAKGYDGLSIALVQA